MTAHVMPKRTSKNVMNEKHYHYLQQFWYIAKLDQQRNMYQF